MAPTAADSTTGTVSIATEPAPIRQLLRLQVAAQRLDISHWALRRMVDAGAVSSHRIGNRIYLEVSEVNRVIEESRRPRSVEREQGNAAA